MDSSSKPSDQTQWKATGRVSRNATVPVLGGLLAGVVVVLWFSSALWFFGQSGSVSY